MPRKPNKLTVDVRGMFSRLVIERVVNDYGYKALAIRWGGASEPVIVLEDSEAREFVAAVGRMIDAP